MSAMASRRMSSRSTLLTASSALAVLCFLTTGFIPPAHSQELASSVSLASFEPQVSSGETVTLLISVHNESTLPLPVGKLDLEASEDVLSTPDELRSWLKVDAAPPGNAVLLGTATVPDIAPEQSATVTFSFSETALPSFRSWGTVGLLASHSVDSRVLSHATTSIVNIGDAPPEPVGFRVIVPLVSEASTLGLMNAESLTQATESRGRLAQMLKAASGAPVTLAVDPRITTSISALGSAAPQTAQLWLEKLRESGREGFWLTYADSDLTGPLQAGAPEIIAPGISDLPNLANSTGSWPGWSPSLSSLLWPASNTIADSNLDALAPGKDKTILVSSANLDADSSQGHVSVAGHNSVVVSEDISGCLARGSTAQNGVDLMKSASCVSSYLATYATDANKPVHVVASFERSVSSGFSSGAFEATLRAATSITWASSTSLRDVMSSESHDATLISHPESADRLALISQLLTNQSTLNSFSEIAREPSLVINPGSRRLASCLSIAWMNRIDWPEAVGVNTTMTNDILNAVAIVPSSTINMVGGQARIPIVVRNDLPSPVLVVLRASPSNARIVIGNDIPVQIEANSQIRSYLPVTARVGSGSVDIDVALFSRDGVPIGSAQTIPVNVRADWESWGLIALGAVFGLLVIAGIFRTVRRRKVLRDV